MVARETSSIEVVVMVIPDSKPMVKDLILVQEEIISSRPQSMVVVTGELLEESLATEEELLE